MVLQKLNVDQQLLVMTDEEYRTPGILDCSRLRSRLFRGRHRRDWPRGLRDQPDFTFVQDQR